MDSNETTYQRFRDEEELHALRQKLAWVQEHYPEVLDEYGQEQD